MDYSSLMVSSLIVAIEIIGVTQWFKKVLPKSVYNKVSNRQLYAIIMLIFSLIFGLVNSPLVPNSLTIIINIASLSIALAQLGYETIIQGIPNIIKALMDKVAK